ncbi:MAG: DUF3299 domain-containing protein [Acidobacteriota bacterium]
MSTANPEQPKTPPESPRTKNKLSNMLLLVTSLATLFYFYSPRTLPSTAFAMGAGVEDAGIGAPKVGWDVLAQLNVETGKPGPELDVYVNETVKIPGYVVPLDEEGMEFLLAPWVGACIHEPTPPPNQLIHVKLKAGAKPIDPWGWDPLWVTGKLKVVNTRSPYGAVGFELAGDSAEIYR